MVHLMTYDELRGGLMAYLFDRETYDGGECENCDTGDHADYFVMTNKGELRICEACHAD